jgi:hypothetical protein
MHPLYFPLAFGRPWIPSTKTTNSKNVFFLLKCIEFNMTKEQVVALGFNKDNSENYSTLSIQ